MSTPSHPEANVSEPSLFSRVVDEISSVTQRQPLATALSAVAVGGVVDRVVPHLAESAKNPVDAVAHEVKRAVQTVIERKASALIDRALGVVIAGASDGKECQNGRREDPRISGVGVH